MNITESGYELELEVQLGDEIKADGSLKSTLEEGDNFSLVTVDFAVVVSALSFNRSDVLVKLYEASAQAARVFGPNSEEVDAIDDDIVEVKAGASLSDFVWLFE